MIKGGFFMEEVGIKPSHNICIKDRKVCEIEGVKKLDSFDNKEFLIDTVQGYLHVKGVDLSLGTMDMDKGFLSIYGTIDSLSYLNKTKSDKKESFFTKIFK